MKGKGWRRWGKKALNGRVERREEGGGRREDENKKLTSSKQSSLLEKECGKK